MFVPLSKKTTCRQRPLSLSFLERSFWPALTVVTLTHEIEGTSCASHTTYQRFFTLLLLLYETIRRYSNIH